MTTKKKIKKDVVIKTTYVYQAPNIGILKDFYNDMVTAFDKKIHPITEKNKKAKLKEWNALAEDIIKIYAGKIDFVNDWKKHIPEEVKETAISIAYDKGEWESNDLTPTKKTSNKKTKITA